MSDIKENVIEWVNGEAHAACTFNQKKYINRILRMREKSPESVTNFVQNPDGSIFCHIPVKAVKLYLITPNASAADDEESEG